MSAKTKKIQLKNSPSRRKRAKKGLFDFTCEKGGHFHTEKGKNLPRKIIFKYVMIHIFRREKKRMQKLDKS